MGSPALLESYADINEHVSSLVYRHFLRDISVVNLRHFPRYLKATLRRLDKLPENPLNDRKLMLEVRGYKQKYQKLKTTSNSSELPDLRWMIEEYCVSLFAQDLKTDYPISAKRLNAQFQQCTH